MLTGIMAGLAAVFALLTVLPLSRRPEWWIRGADFPRVQFMTFGAALLIGALTMLELDHWHSWLIAAVTAAGVIYHAWWIIPYTPFFRQEVKSAEKVSADDRIRIVSFNVLMTNRRADELLRMVRNERPDVLVTLETNAWWESAVSSLESDYPHTLKCPLENLYGMHLYSRFPLEDPKIQFLVEAGRPSMHTLVVLPRGRKICLHLLHPAPPSPTENPTSEERDAELVVVGRSAARARFPVIVSGDLNDVAWSATTRLFRKISGLLDPRVGRGMYNTFHAEHWFMRWPVDHFFHSKHFTLVRVARLKADGSDHFPVLMEVQCEDVDTGAGEGLAAEGEDETEAREKMAKKAVSSVIVHRPGEKKPPRREEFRNKLGATVEGSGSDAFS